MNEQRFPAGWDEQRVKRLLAELDGRTEEEWVAADKAAAAAGGIAGERARRGSRKKFRRALDKVADVAPEERDQLPADQGRK
jgi:hypothetical protein